MSIGPVCILGERIPGAGGASPPTDVYLPETAPAPTLLVRTPYGRSALAWEGVQWSQMGFAFVVQELRPGPADSNGAVSDVDIADGLAVLRWIDAQPWSDGSVIPIGTADEVAPAVAAAGSGHPSIRGVALVAPSSVSSRPISRLPLLEWPLWAALGARVGSPGSVDLLDMLQAREPLLLHRLPVTSIAEQVGLPPEVFTTAGGEDSKLLDAVRSLSVPSLHVGSWYDPLIEQAMALHDATGADAEPRPPRSRIIGPWAFPEHVKLAPECDLDFAGAEEQPPQAFVAHWLESLCSKQLDFPSRWFVTGTNEWEAEWGCLGPATEWHATADGMLRLEPSSDIASVRFKSDPLNPCPSLPHSTDHAELTERPDVVSFTTEPLRASLGWSRARIELRATSSSPTTDWIVRLLRVLPDGRAHLLGLAGVEAPGGESRHQLELPVHAVRLAPGDRLRLQISSTWFPYVARNLQNCESRWEGTRCAVAEQRITVGASSTRVILTGAS